MKHDRNHEIRKWGILIVDLFCVLVSYLIALLIRFQSIRLARASIGNQYSIFLGAVLVISVLFFNYVYTKNRHLFSRNWILEIKLIIIYNIYLMVMMIVVSYLMHTSMNLSRLVTMYFVITNVFIMMFVRQVLKKSFTAIYGRASSYSTVVLVTKPELKDALLKEFNTGLTYKIIGVLTYENGMIDGNIHEVKIHSALENLPFWMIQIPCDNIVFNIPEEAGLKEVIDEFEDMGVNCFYMLNVSSFSEENIQFTRFGDLPVAAFTLNERSSWKLLLKRIFDVCVSIVGLLFCAIIGIFVVPAIKLESPGPAVFSQIRIGKNGRKFKFYKFRSMYQDAEERKKELEAQNEMNGLMFKMEDDPRITKVGKFIRKTSLDEFPQFWNVLIGDMSIIGTRPPTEDEFNKYSSHQKRRLSMLPGITGLWQVSGRSQITDFDEVVKLDLEYIDNWSLTLDVEIFFKTFSAVLKRKGAS